MKTSITKGLAAALICSATLTTAQAQGVKVNGKEIPASRIEAVVKSQVAQGRPDTPDNYHTVTVELSERPGGTRISLSQDNNATAQMREHSEKNWNTALAGLKTVVEQRR